MIHSDWANKIGLEVNKSKPYILCLSARFVYFPLDALCCCITNSVGDGVNWPIQARDQDSDRLLDDDRDEELQSPSEGTPTRG